MGLVPECFITELVERDLKEGKYAKLVTRFPRSPTATSTSATPGASF